MLLGLIRWVRLRLWAALWREWKTQRRRRAALLELGVRPRLASNTAGSGLDPWYLARAKALCVGLSNAYFESLGLPSLVDEERYQLSNRRVRPVRTVVWQGSVGDHRPYADLVDISSMWEHRYPCLVASGYHLNRAMLPE